MSSDPYSPITTSRVLDEPRGHRVYTTTRKVAAEFPLPGKGEVLSEANFIGGFGTVGDYHYILDVSDYPDGDGKKVSVTHSKIPAGTFTEYESLGYVFPPIYPKTSQAHFPGGSKARSRTVTARVEYEYTTNPAASPTNWRGDATIWDFSSVSSGPFEVRSYLSEAAGANFVAADGSSGLVGDFLNPSFVGQDTLNDIFRIYSPGSLFYSVGASSPSAATYLGWITSKSEFMASRTIHKWYCFYMRRTVWVRAQ